MGFEPHVYIERCGYSAFGLAARARLLILMLARRAPARTSEGNALQLAELPQPLLEFIAELLLTVDWYDCTYRSDALMSSADFSRMMIHKKVLLHKYLEIAESRAAFLVDPTERLLDELGSFYGDHPEYAQYRAALEDLEENAHANANMDWNGDISLAWPNLDRASCWEPLAFMQLRGGSHGLFFASPFVKSKETGADGQPKLMKRLPCVYDDYYGGRPAWDAVWSTEKQLGGPDPEMDMAESGLYVAGTCNLGLLAAIDWDVSAGDGFGSRRSVLGKLPNGADDMCNEINRFIRWLCDAHKGSCSDFRLVFRTY